MCSSPYNQEDIWRQYAAHSPLQKGSKEETFAALAADIQKYTADAAQLTKEIAEPDEDVSIWREEGHQSNSFQKAMGNMHVLYASNFTLKEKPSRKWMNPTAMVHR